MSNGTLVIYKSSDCEEWTPVKASEVPDWARAPDVVGRMVDGEACQLNYEGDWYIAKRVLNGFDHGAILAAKAKRIRRAERNIRVMH